MARSKQKHSRKNRCRKDENETTPKKNRNPLTPYTPRIKLINFDLLNMSQKKTCRSFTIMNPNINKDLNMSPSKMIDNVIIIPSPQSKKQESQYLEGINPKLCGDNDEGSRKEPDIFSDLIISPSKISNDVNYISLPQSQKPENQSLNDTNPKPYTDNDEESSGKPDLFSELYTNRSKYKNTVVSSSQTNNRVNRRLNFDIDKDQESYKDSEEKTNSSSDEPYEDSGSEYVPSEIEEEIECEIGDELEEMKYFQHDERQHLNDLDYSSDYFEAFGDDVSVKTKRSKGQACLFCGKLVIQLPRHFERKHAGEAEIIKLMSLQKRSPERLKMLDNLRKKGNFVYNSKMLTMSSGEIIVKKRPTKANKRKNDYLPCTNCLGFYNRKSLHRHVRKCNEKMTKWARVQSMGSLLLPVNKHASRHLRERVLSIMKNDEITSLIKQDSLILQYGSFLCEKFSNEDERHLNTHVSQKMREIGRFLFEVKKLNTNIKNLSILLQPKYFDLIVNATKITCEYNIDTGRFKIPSLASKIGHSLLKCSKILKAGAVRSQNNVLRKTVDDYIFLHETEWQVQISRKVKYTLDTTRYNKPNLLPLASDIQLLTAYLNQTEEKLCHHIISESTYSNYLELSKIILTRLVLFNRRRIGELQRLRCSSFINRNKIDSHSDVYQSLTTEEKTLASGFCHVETRGKKGRKVAVLMSKSTENNIILLLNMRKKVGIPDKNPFLFAIRNEQGYINGSEAFRKIVSQCNLSLPESIRSTNLRKHIATMSQVMCLRQNEMDVLANFMGHDPRIHREFYKLPQTSIHLAKLSKLLLAVQSGEIEKYKGQNLDTIDVDVLREDEGAVSESDEDEQPLTSNELKKITTDNLRKTCIKRSWTTQETNAIKKHLSHYLLKGEIPGRIPCENCIAQEPDLKNRTWQHVKFWVYNNRKKYSE